MNLTAQWLMETKPDEKPLQKLGNNEERRQQVANAAMLRQQEAAAQEVRLQQQQQAQGESSLSRAVNQGKLQLAKGLHDASIGSKAQWLLKLADSDSNVDKALKGMQKEDSFRRVSFKHQPSSEEQRQSGQQMQLDKSKGKRAALHQQNRAQEHQEDGESDGAQVTTEF